MNNLLISFFILIVNCIAFVKSDFIRSCIEPKTIAITFDDGPWKYTTELVDYLISQNDIRVTFFTVGRFHYPFAIDYEEYQNAMKKAHDYGFQIASHTFGHKISNVTEEFVESLTMQDDFIERVTGDRPHYFRAPKGECDENCKAVLDERGYRLIQWDTDVRDWDLESSGGSIEQRTQDSLEILRQNFAEERDSYLVLMHDIHNYTVSTIAPWVFEQSGMREKGYRFVTVAECLGEKNYMYVSGKTYNDEQFSNVHNQQYLESDGFLAYKPMSFMITVCLSLIAIILLSMN